MIGEPIGIGRTAEVFAWKDGQVVKLLRPGFPDALGEMEARIARSVNAAGLSAPKFMGTTRAEGRLGLVYERIIGPSMLDRLAARPWLVDLLARRFAALHASMHETIASDLPEVGDYHRRMIERAAADLGPDGTSRILDRLDELGPGSVVCHGDMHPGNVLLTARGPIVIDWLTAGAGEPEADVARSLFLLESSDVPGEVPALERALIGLIRRRFARSYLRRYRQLRPLDAERLGRWRLPVLGARLGEGIETERPRLLAAIGAELARAAS